MTTKRDQMDWRRTKVLELSSQGHSEREIASALQIGKTTVHQDLTFLNKQAQETKQHHIHTVVPFEYQKCVTGMRHNLKQTLEIAETVADPRVKLQARSIANEAYRHLMDLHTNADALKFVEKRRDTLQKLNEQIEETEEAQEETAGGVF